MAEELSSCAVDGGRVVEVRSSRGWAGIEANSISAGHLDSLSTTTGGFAISWLLEAFSAYG